MEHQGTSEIRKMAQNYVAAAKRNPGRNAWLVEFRHPLRNDSNNKPGRKIRKGLGTDNEDEARRLVEQLNELLKNERLWSLGAKPEASKQYDARVIEIFYGEIEPRGGSALQLRDKLLPLPSRDEGYARVLLMGVPGAGKTTLVRQLIGTHPKSERFPSTSVNRTTTFPTEVALHDGEYEGVVTFMSEHETRFEIEESLSAAFIEAIAGNTKQVARAFLEKSDMRFRLKYLLGDHEVEQDEIDPYDDDKETEALVVSDSTEGPTSAERIELQKTLNGYINRINAMASEEKTKFEAQQGDLVDEMSPEDRNAAFDLIEGALDRLDTFIDLVSDILDEVRTKFELVTDGRFEKTTTGWPKAWHIKKATDERASFLAAIRFFSDNHHRSWGKLLTPLVNSMRVVGPFKPNWTDQTARLVIVDTEGLGHKADTTADLPEHVLPLLQEADVILLVESAKNGMTNFASGKALEAVVNTGHTRKLAVIFTSMDLVKGDNLRGRAKTDHVFGGLRNIVDNQLAKNVSADAARSFLNHLETNTFYVGRINELDPTPAKPELNKLLSYLAAAQPPVFVPVALPEYRDDKLGFAIQDAAREFRQKWKEFLGFADVRPKPWQTKKAMTRRHAEGWGYGFVLSPTDNLLAALLGACSRFLETPIGWSGNPTPDQKRETIDRIKSKIARNLPLFCTRRLRDLPQLQWQEAYSLHGDGSTKVRDSHIEGIFERFVPIPDAVSEDRAVWEFLDEVKDVVMKAINEIKDEISAAKNVSP
jgi:ethanolamine utilization protein EutP (predicted NTPase)